MPLSVKRQIRPQYLFFAIAMISTFSFLYLNMCADTNAMFSEYIGELSYTSISVETFALADLQFFEIALERIMELIFERA